MGLMRSWIENCLKRLNDDRSGASAIEFAFLAPLLLAVYLSCFEITNAYTTAGKVLKAAGTVADITARQTLINKSWLNEMMDAAEATIAPSSTTALTMKVSGISIDSASNAKILWSWDQNGNTPYTKGASVTIPSDMKKPSSFLVHAEVSLPYTLLLYLDSGATLTKQTRSFTITREFYYRQRLGNSVACSDCF